MQRLARIDHVKNGVGMPMLHPIADGRQVRSRVSEGPVGLADQNWFFVVLVENYYGPLAFCGDSLPLKLAHDIRQHRVIETFAMRVIESQDAEPFVDVLDFLITGRHERLPK